MATSDIKIDELTEKVSQIDISSTDKPKFKYINRFLAKLNLINKDFLPSYIQELTKLPDDNEWFLSVKSKVAEVDKVYGYKYDISSMDDKITDVMKQVIGKDGCYFLKTTTDTGILFLWFDKTTSTIEFYGPKDNIREAINRINYRISKFI